MPISIHHYHHFDGDAPGVGHVLAEILSLEKKIMASQKEFAEQLKQVTEQLKKIGVESAASLAKVEELKAIIAGGPPITPELQAAFDELAAQVKVVDDLVPDAPPA